MTDDERVIIEALVKSVADVTELVRQLATRVQTVETLLDDHLSHKLRLG